MKSFKSFIFFLFFFTLCSCYNCGGLDHHAKECDLPPQPKKCHYCQSITHMVAHCPHRALTPSSGSQDPYASTSASASATGPYLCPPEEEQRSGSSPPEGSSSSNEEPHTQRGSRTQRWRKSWKRPPPMTPSPPTRGELWWLNLLTLAFILNQGYLEAPPHFNPPLIYLTPVEKNIEVFIVFYFEIMIFLNQHGYGNDHLGTSVCECVWQSSLQL